MCGEKVLDGIPRFFLSLRETMKSSEAKTDHVLLHRGKDSIFLKGRGQR